MPRRVGNAGGAEVREMMLRDLEYTAAAHQRICGTPLPLAYALQAGRSVQFRWWELPDEIKAELPALVGIQEHWELTEDDVLVAV